MNKKDFLIYINGFLTPIAILNNVPNCGKDFGFEELNLVDNDLESSIKIFLGTPNWKFKFRKLEENWKDVLRSNISWAFTAIVGKTTNNSTLIRNLDFMQDSFITAIANYMAKYDSVDISEIEIINQFDNDGYFAHGEYNILFRTSEEELFLLYLRDSD